MAKPPNIKAMRLTFCHGRRNLCNKERFMNRLPAIASAVVLTSWVVSSAHAQSVISAHSGLIHYVEGQTFLDSNPVEVKISKFPEMKENMELTTKDGRAEVLLNPGAFLRVGENS